MDVLQWLKTNVSVKIASFSIYAGWGEELPGLKGQTLCKAAAQGRVKLWTQKL